MSGFSDTVPVEVQAPEVGTDNISDVLDMDRTGVIFDAVNFVWEEIIDPFFVHSGKSLYDLILEPISGDFNRIRANGDAWRHAGELYWSLDQNLSDNATKLRKESWPAGQASDAFIGRINLIWTPALFIAKGVCNWVAKGFDRLADIAIKLAQEAADLINMVARRLDKLASKLGGPVGIAKALWDAFWDGEWPFISDIKAIYHGIVGIIDLYDKIDAVVQKAIALFKQAEQLVTGVEGITELPSVHRAVDLAKGVKQAKAKAAETKEAYQEAKESYEEQLDNLEPA